MIESSCCGTASSFGYEAKRYEVLMRMAEASLLPKVRETDSQTLIVADGTAREAVHDVRGCWRRRWRDL